MARSAPVIADAASPFGTLEALLGQARAGALFPDVARVTAWVSLVRLPARGGRPTPATLQASGFPGPSTLEVLHRLKATASSLVGPKAGRRVRESAVLTAALLKADLPPLAALEAKLVAREPGLARFLVVVDAIDRHTGCPVRFSARLVQRRGSHLGLSRDGQARVSPGLADCLTRAVSGTAEALLRTLRALEGLEVEEVVRGQLGPFLDRSRPVPWPALAEALGAAPSSQGALALELERAGPGVSSDFDGHPFSPLDCSPATVGGRDLFGYHVSRELRLVCTPALLDPVRKAVTATGKRAIVRV